MQLAISSYNCIENKSMEKIEKNIMQSACFTENHVIQLEGMWFDYFFSIKRVGSGLKEQVQTSNPKLIPGLLVHEELHMLQLYYVQHWFLIHKGYNLIPWFPANS